LGNAAIAAASVSLQDFFPIGAFSHPSARIGAIDNRDGELGFLNFCSNSREIFHVWGEFP
jgi:hypothetical protein